MQTDSSVDSLEKSFRIWKITCFFCLFMDSLLCGGVLFLVLNLDNMELTKIYIGLAQSIIGLFLIFICSLGIYFNSKTPVVFYVVCSLILHIASAVMFILVKLSEEVQYYNGIIKNSINKLIPFLEEAPLQPAHPKQWFRFYKVYFILSLTLSSYNIVISVLFCKICSLISRRRKLMKTDPRTLKRQVTKSNQTSSEEKNILNTSINNLENIDNLVNKCEFQKPLLINECLISFEPHKGIESSHKNLGNSLRSNEIYSPDEENSKHILNYSYPPTSTVGKDHRIYKRSDNLRSVEKEKNDGYIKKFKNEGERKGR